MLKSTHSIFLAWLIIPVSALAQEQTSQLPLETKARVFANMADDQARCSAFYEIVSECMNNTKPGSGDPSAQLSLSVMQSAAMLLTLSNTLTLQEAGKELDTERLTEASAKAATNWFHRYKQEMLDEALTCANLSVLLEQHLDPCNQYYREPDALREKWVKILVPDSDDHP